MIRDLAGSYLWTLFMAAAFTMLCGYCGSEGRGFRPVQNVREGWLGAVSVESAVASPEWERLNYGDVNVSVDEMKVIRKRTKLICNHVGKKVLDVEEHALKLGFLRAGPRDLVALAQTYDTYLDKRIVIVTGDPWYEPETTNLRYAAFRDVTNRSVVPSARLRVLHTLSQEELEDAIILKESCLLMLRPEKGEVTEQTLPQEN